MSARHFFAVGVALGAMTIALAQPLWIRATGDEVTLEIQPVDPQSLFRGNYVDLGYDIDLDAPRDVEPADVVYVVFNRSRPARALRVTQDRPSLSEDEVCIKGVYGRRGISFPTLEQFFVTPDQGKALETRLSSLVAVVRVTDSCRSILVAIEPK